MKTLQTLLLLLALSLANARVVSNRKPTTYIRDPMSSACTRSSGITLSMMNIDAVKTEPAQRRSKSHDKSARDLSNRDLFYTWLGQSFQPSPYFVYP